MSRDERRQRTTLKLRKRQRLMAMLGLQGGCVYEKHREKIGKSIGYMRTGNVSHFVSTKPRKKTRSRDRYGRVFTPPARNAARLDSMNAQLETEKYNE